MDDLASDQIKVQYQIGEFLLIPLQSRLQRGTAEWKLSPQRLKVLTLLASIAPEHASVDLLRQRVWKGQIRATNTIHQAILDLRKYLEDSDQTLIKTDEEGSYYLGFPVIPSVASPEHNSEVKSEPTEYKPDLSSNQERVGLATFMKGFLLGAALAVTALIPFLPATQAMMGTKPAVTAIYSPADEEAIAHVVRESQLFITLQVYSHPHNVDQARIKEYLVPESAGGKEAATVRKMIDRLEAHNVQYGEESKNEGFEVTSVTVFSPGDTAEATTLETWYVPAYRDGKRDQSRKAVLGPYRLVYRLRKLADKWRIESSTTPVRKG